MTCFRESSVPKFDVCQIAFDSYEYMETSISFPVGVMPSHHWLSCPYFFGGGIMLLCRDLPLCTRRRHSSAFFVY